jgi:hypothetical protein
MLREYFTAIAGALSDFSFRVRAGAVALLVVPPLLANLSGFGDVLRSLHRSERQDEVSAHEKRLEPLKAVLPERGVVGYVTDAADVEQAKRFYMTQYVLAPLIVVEGATPRLVVGDFSDTATADAHFDHGSIAAQAFGSGILLLTRTQK